MRPIGMGLLLALVVGLVAPSAAFAAGKTEAPAITKDQRDKGTAAAPGLISASHMDCDVADARLVGEGTDPKTKVKQTVYELACKNNEGMMVVKKGDDVTAFSCLQADQPGPDGKPSSTRCLLPANADPKSGLAAYVQKAKVACDIDKARAIGQSPTNAFFEVSCTNNPGGFILETTVPMSPQAAVTAEPCIMAPETGTISCTLTARAQQLSVVDKLSSASGKPCEIKEGGRGFLAAAQSGKYYYEEACSDGHGYVLVANADGSFAQAIPCAQADAVFGGCKLTDARTARTEQAGLYSQLAHKAGYDCNVAGYAPLPGLQSLPNDEVVELKCENRPDGAIGFFPASNGAGVVYDCAHAQIFGYRCVLTKPDASFKALTLDLNKAGKKECTVSESRGVGVSAADKSGFLEVGCADGLPGYMIKYTVDPPQPMAVQSAIVCSLASGIGGGCTLPNNNKKS